MRLLGILGIFLFAFLMALGLGAYGVFIWPAVAMAVVVALLLGPLKPWEEARVGLAFAYAGLFIAGWIQSHPYPDFDRNPGKMFLTAFVALGGLSLLGFAMAARASKSWSVMWWLILAIGCGVLGLYSGDAGGPDPMMAWLSGKGIVGSQAELLLLLTRKTVHFLSYGFMALFAYRFAFAAGRNPAMKFALSFAMLHGCFDEARQLFAKERTGSPIDVFIDMLGALFFLWVAGAFRRQAR